jgi:hypothetical protein
MSMAIDLHSLFGAFEIFFEPVADQQHTYRIKTFLPPELALPDIPVTRTLYLMNDKSIDPPSSRLLAIHSAICPYSSPFWSW